MTTAAQSRYLRALRRQVRDRAEHHLTPEQVAFLSEVLDLDGRDDTKPCTGPCGEDKPVAEFGMDRGYRRGPCRVCENESKRKPGAQPRTGVKPCGTPAAAHRHYRAGEKPCAPCAKAVSAAQSKRDRERRAREKTARQLQPAA